MKIVIVGNGPAGVRALEAIANYRAVSGTDGGEITVVSRELTAAYAPMFLVGYLTQELGEEELLLEERHNLSPNRVLGETVAKVEDSENRIILESGKEIGYDRLLIASGASPINPPIKGIDKEGVHFFNRLDDVKRLSQHLPSAENIVIIGAGATGIEAAIALNRMGKNVLVVDLLGQILPQMLDEDLAGYLEGKLSDAGIRFSLGECVSEVKGDNQAAGIVIGDKEITGDLILIACGLSPNIDFLRSSNVRVNKGILVNEKMRTNVRNIYAAGDVAESIDPYGGYELVFNWHNAIDQGWTAGCNLIGIENVYRPSPGLAAIKGIDPLVISIGRRYNGDGCEILSCINEEKGAYEKIFIKSNHIDCYQAIGMSDKIGLMYSYIKEQKDIQKIKNTCSGSYSLASLVA